MHMCFEVEDIDAAVARLRAIGVEPDGEPITFQEEDGLRRAVLVQVSLTLPIQMVQI